MLILALSYNIYNCSHDVHISRKELPIATGLILYPINQSINLIRLQHIRIVLCKDQYIVDLIG